MSPKKLAGYLLVVGPIVTFVVMMFLWDAIIGSPDESLIGQEKIKAGMELGMDNFVVTQTIASLATFGMLAMWFGYTFWARSLQSDNKKSGILVPWQLSSCQSLPQAFCFRWILISPRHSLGKTVI